MESVSRRNFVTAAAAATVAGAAARTAWAAQAVDPQSIAWDYTCDVVVCGSGGGLLAACDLADAGNEVILIEKAPMLGGECSMNEGWINGAGTVVQEAEGVEDSAEIQLADYSANQAAHLDNVDPDLLAAYCADSGAAVDRLVELGCEYVLAQDTMFYTTVPRAHILQPSAAQWPVVLGPAAEERGVQILTETPLTDLLVDGTGQVIGVRSNEFAIKARKGVVLATGDVSANARMKAKFQPQWAEIPAWDPYNEGDGLFAALAAGADSSFDQFTAVGPCLDYYPSGAAMTFYQVLKGAIIVNKEGTRFANEDDNTLTAGVQAAQTDGEAFFVFDARVAAMSMRPDCPVTQINEKLFTGECVEIGLISGVGPAYLDDYDGLGTYESADSLEELAEAVGVDPAGLVQQVAAWNDAVAAGVDEQFGRTMTGALQFGPMVGIEEPPFYAMRLQPPRWMCTEGPNLMVDPSMAVLDVKGEPIARLFACGAGLMAGTCTLYANVCGDHMGITAVSARRAAASAGSLEPWEA